jgi:hypothetical protein
VSGLARLVHRHNTRVSCGVGSPAVEHTKLQASGILDGESRWQFNNPPRRWETADHGFFCFAGLRVIPAHIAW